MGAGKSGAVPAQCANAGSRKRLIARSTVMATPQRAWTPGLLIWFPRRVPYTWALRLGAAKLIQVVLQLRDRLRDRWSAFPVHDQAPPEPH